MIPTRPESPTQDAIRLPLKRPRVVSFAPEETNAQATALSSDVALWYHSTEIAAFKKQVANVLLYSKNKEDFSGLERHNLKRSQAKKKAIRLAVLSQSKGPEFLSLLYRQATRPARNMAFAQGIHDYCAAYDKKIDMSQSSSSSTKCKRKTPVHESNSRCVRRRTQNDETVCCTV